MFITATALNPLVVDLIAQATNLEVHLTWGQWALGMFLPGIAAMLLMPLVLYFLSPLEIKSTPNASAFAKDKLKELGKMKNSEKIMLSVFVLLLLLWAGALGEFASAMGLGEISIMIFLSLAFFIYTLFLCFHYSSYICNVFLFFIVQLALGAPPLLYAFIMIASQVML
ncbi:C4-dicarboxylate transporter [Campylobacter jejuni]|nr:C4-dicarboxylate transporter [Campylobacter jejuni]